MGHNHCSTSAAAAAPVTTKPPIWDPKEHYNRKPGPDHKMHEVFPLPVYILIVGEDWA